MRLLLFSLLLLAAAAQPAAAQSLSFCKALQKVVADASSEFDNVKGKPAEDELYESDAVYKPAFKVDKAHQTFFTDMGAGSYGFRVHWSPYATEQAAADARQKIVSSLAGCTQKLQLLPIGVPFTNSDYDYKLYHETPKGFKLYSAKLELETNDDDEYEVRFLLYAFGDDYHVNKAASQNPALLSAIQTARDHSHAAMDGAQPARGFANDRGEKISPELYASKLTLPGFSDAFIYESAKETALWAVYALDLTETEMRQQLKNLQQLVWSTVGKDYIMGNAYPGAATFTTLDLIKQHDNRKAPVYIRKGKNSDGKYNLYLVVTDPF